MARTFEARPDRPLLELGDRRPVPALVLSPASDPAHARVLGQRLAHRTTERAGADAVDDDDLVEPGQQRIVEVGIQSLDRGLDPLAVKVEAR